MKKVTPSKLLINRAEKIVETIMPEAYPNSENANILAYMLELPVKNTVKGDEYGTLLTDVLTAINNGVELDVESIYTRIKSVVVTAKRELSPDVRKARYEKACKKLAEKYGMSEV